MTHSDSIPQQPEKRHALFRAAVTVLKTADPAEKVALTAKARLFWLEKLPFDDVAFGTGTTPPDRPARPAKPNLLPPNQVPRRRINRAAQGRIALLHAIAHIELNAIDLAWDIIARFGAEMPDAFLADWCTVAYEEGFHFSILRHRLRQLGADYGDLPAHGGLWESSQKTADDLMARLAIVPMVLEARGLDVTPQMIIKLQQVEDFDTAVLLQRIHDDEISHVAAGKRWFDHLIGQKGEAAREQWQNLVLTRFQGDLKPPFNKPSRDKAGFPYDWYAPISAQLAYSS